MEPCSHAVDGDNAVQELGMRERSPQAHASLDDTPDAREYAILESLHGFAINLAVGASTGCLCMGISSRSCHNPTAGDDSLL